MRPSPYLIALVLICAAVTVFASVWWRDMTYPLLLMWLALAALTVADLVKQITAKTGEKISIRRFTRYKMGEGLEKRSDDFGQEIARLTNQ